MHLFILLSIFCFISLMREVSLILDFSMSFIVFSFLCDLHLDDLTISKWASPLKIKQSRNIVTYRRQDHYEESWYRSCREIWARIRYSSIPEWTELFSLALQTLLQFSPSLDADYLHSLKLMLLIEESETFIRKLFNKFILFLNF